MVLQWTRTSDSLDLEKDFDHNLKSSSRDVKKLTSSVAWNPVFGELSPTYLPFRGFTATRHLDGGSSALVNSTSEFWHHGNILSEQNNEGEILKENL
ncbi:hypothetical protein TNIN_177391 [Trichonephila inaurata madagascariensis]|uniref:Uncharacterized protein n=1 Tax=Trichonephila inaurata madagascariensis TaxID=2747483 RepID=A0A8X6YR58_9ARAC|nr:hypothetical protein TNIN_177391 [Trichonephila inaurata madagascariensis]